MIVNTHIIGYFADNDKIKEKGGQERFVFGYLNVGNSNYRSKTNAGVTATGCNIYSP